MLAILFTVALLQSPVDCPNVEACRAQALIAEAGGDFETFHDLAWRAVQKGKRNDPELMTILARAMAESGRPGDAIVMLSRLADMGVKVDASGDEFKVVRTLKDWPAVEAKLAAIPERGSGAPPVSSSPQPAPPESRSTGTKEKRIEAPAAPTSEPAAAPAPAPLALPPGEPILDFDAPAFTPAGLAYDAVSRRFVVGDREAAKLLIIDQRSQHVVTLVAAAAAGFFDQIGGLAVDPRRGDLWVVSAGSAEGRTSTSAIHKLQLVSGRTLMDVTVPADFGDVRFVDVSVTPSGTVYALDAAGRRIFRLRPGAHAVDVVAAVSGAGEPKAFGVVDDQVAFVADAGTIRYVQLATGDATPIQSSTDLSDVRALLPRSGFLYAIQSGQLIQITLDRSRQRATSVRTIDSASAVTASDGKVYYLCAPGQIRVVDRSR